MLQSCECCPRLDRGESQKRVPRNECVLEKLSHKKECHVCKHIKLMPTENETNKKKNNNNKSKKKEKKIAIINKNNENNLEEEEEGGKKQSQKENSTCNSDRKDEDQPARERLKKTKMSECSPLIFLFVSFCQCYSTSNTEEREREREKAEINSLDLKRNN